MFFAAVTEAWVEWMGRGAEEFLQGQYHTLFNASLHDTLPIRKGRERIAQKPTTRASTRNPPFSPESYTRLTTNWLH